MRADTTQQHLLLEVQAIDTEVARHRHSSAVRDLDRQLREMTDQMAALRRRLVAAETEAADLQREIARSEEDVRRVRARLERDRDLAGQGMSAKVQRELEHELASLQRRLTDLEDAELDLLQQHEDLLKSVEELRSSQPALSDQIEALTAQRAQTAAQAQARLVELASERNALVTRLAPDLVARYESIRADTPVAVAELTGSQCGGCRLQLPPADLADLAGAAGDELVMCPECGCILVRD